MRRILLLTFLCFLAISFTGCKRARLRMQLKDLMSATIVLPERVSMVYNGVISSMPDSLRTVPKLIVYIDSSECTTCRIGMYQGVIHLSEEKGTFEVILLLSNVNLNGIAVTRYLSDMEISLPVYVDDENAFLDLNPSIPKDRRMHAFLVDDNGTPLCVGDPTASREMLLVLTGAVDKLTSNYNNGL